MNQISFILELIIFNYIWERLIDFTYGISNKQDYFPRTQWNLIYETKNAKGYALEPDTIMSNGDDVFVLDAKYYKIWSNECHERFASFNKY